MIVLKEKELSQEEGELELRQNITKLIWEMGISTKLKGYVYLREAIVQAVLHPETSCGQLYKLVADQYQTKSKSIEFTIRYAIENAYDTNPKQLQDCFPYPVVKPSNLEVISLIADQIRTRLS